MKSLSSKYDGTDYRYDAIGSEAPETMTMDRVRDCDELILAQTTMLCFRESCCRPSINWVLTDGNNFTPGISPFDLSPNGGWIHEESTFLQRCLVGHVPGCRETKFVQHSSLPPAAMRSEDWQCFVIQPNPSSDFLTAHELRQDVVAIHEKEMTLCTGCCCDQPYLTTTDREGRFIGETQYVCDEYICVPKIHVIDKNGEIKYMLRPDTCICGLCVMPRCGGQGGKCFRVPFLIRDPVTHDPVVSNAQEGTGQVTFLWTGLVNEAFLKRHAYHIVFPAEATLEDRLTLIGSSIFVDVALYETEDDNNYDQ